MTREEIKQWLRNQIDSSLKIQSKRDKSEFHLCYNKSYIRAKKLSTITGQTVNKENYNGDMRIFIFNTTTKIFWSYEEIDNYFYENYSKEFHERKILIEEVINDYEGYKDYRSYW